MSTPAVRRQILERVLAQISGEDRERMLFLERLDAAEEIEVTDWEAEFIESFLNNVRPFTAAQRAAVDGMREEYGAEI